MVSSVVPAARLVKDGMRICVFEIYCLVEEMLAAVPTTLAVGANRFLCSRRKALLVGGGSRGLLSGFDN